MATPRQQAMVYEALVEKHGRIIAETFLRLMREISADVQFSDLVAAIDSRDTVRIAEVMGITEGRLFPLADAYRSGYVGGGLAVGTIEGARFSFDGRHIRAEQFIAQYAGSMVQGVIQESQEVIRRVLLEGVREGMSTSRVARTLIGEGKARKGGRIGLTTEQSDWVSRSRQQLSDLDGSYFTRSLRDRRFDATVRKAIDSGKPLTKAQIDRITGRYAEKIEAYRARNIGRYEARQAVTAGQAEGYAQVAEDMDVESVTVRWQYNYAGQESREDHIRASQEEPRTLPVGDPWVMDDGTRMTRPHDPAGGPAQNMSCRCVAIHRITLKAD